MTDRKVKNNGVAGSFDSDVPEALQDDILQRIVEAAWDLSPDEDISIVDVERLNALNIEAIGSILIDGEEHSFHIRDGNNAGTEILAWNEDRQIHREQPDPKVLAPLPERMREAIGSGSAWTLLTTWKNDSDGTGAHGKSLADLPGSAAYDAFFAPGSGAAQSHHAKAAALGYRIVPLSEAVPMRKELISRILRIVPGGDYVTGEGDSAQHLAHWRNARDPETERGAAIRKVVDAITDRMAGDESLITNKDEDAALNDLDVRVSTRRHEVTIRKMLFADILSMTPIEGFDPADLPENPMAVLFKALDPDLVGTTRVHPEYEAARIIERLCEGMALSESDDIPDHWFEAAEKIGYRLSVASVPDEPDDSPEMGY